MTALGRHFRTQAALYALLAAMCQLGVAMSASTVMLTSARTGAAIVADECSCDHSAAVMCPMHRRSAPRPLPAGTPRWCGAGDDSVFALVPTLGALGAPEAFQQILPPSSVPLAFALHADRPVRTARPPDNPPPRA